ncbi:MAG: hypothetical protein AB7L90_01315 [Hyphomicrobiaceae bacterium]
MSGVNDDLDIARAALRRARNELARQLEAEPAWRALGQLDAKQAGPQRTASKDIAAIRSNIITLLDASIPEWRALAGIDATVAALGRVEGAAQPQPRAAPPPLPAGGRSDRAAPPRVPHVRLEPERTRYGPAHDRPAAAKPAPPEPTEAPSERAPTMRRVIEAPPAPLPRPRPASKGGRLAAALGLAGEGPARLSAIEADVERLMRRDAGTWDRANSSAVPPPLTAHAEQSPGAVLNEPEVVGDEAEVEIITTAAAPVRDEGRPITRLADRLSRTRGGPDEGDTVREPVVSMQAEVEEATVEIVVPDGPAR